MTFTLDYRLELLQRCILHWSQIFVLNFPGQLFYCTIHKMCERAVNQKHHIFVKSLTAVCESDSKPLQSARHNPRTVCTLPSSMDL